MKFQRIFSLFLALLMTFSTFAGAIPANAFAEETQEIPETQETTEPKVIANYTVPMEDVIVNEDGSLTINLPDDLPVETDPVETDPVETDPVETDPVETDPVETDPVETDPVETDPVETDPVETDPVETDPVETDPVETDPVETDPVETDPVETDPIETNPLETEPEETEPEETVEVLTWFQWIEEKAVDLTELDKEEHIALRQEYEAYCANTLAEAGEMAEGAAYQKVSNDYIEVAVGSNGHFTIGNKKGNPAWDSDDNQILLFGHPNPDTSETLIRIDGRDYGYFRADSSSKSGTTITSSMNISDYKIKVVQTLKLIKVGSSEFEDTVQIQYQVYNNDNKNHDVGIRIMMDTMLADNDWATFHTSEAITAEKVYEGKDAIPGMYQVYDKTTNPTTLATGYLYRGSDRVPDKVQFCNWGRIQGSGWNHHVSDGDELGDSAVGIYFNPVTVAGNSSTTVKTYYGVSVGSASGSSTTLSGNKVKLIIRDSYTKVPLEGVKISYTIKGSDRQYSYTTDINGTAILAGFEPDKAVSRQPKYATVTVSKSGYKGFSNERKQWRGGSTQTIYLSTSSTEKPTIQSVILAENGKETDLLSSSVAFVEDTNNRIGKDGATGSVIISATADMENCTWKLLVGDKEVASLQNASFFLCTRSSDHGTFIEKLSAGGNVYIQAISPKGVKSEKTRIGLNIRANHKVDLPIMDVFTLLPGGKSPLNKNTLAALFLGHEFEFGPKKCEDFLKFQVKLKDDGSFVVGLNMDANLLDTMDKKIGEGKKTKADLIEELQAEMAQAIKDKKKGKFPSLSKYGFGSASVDFIFSGFGAGNVVNGEAKFTLNVAIALSGKSSYKTRFIVGSVPCFVNVSGELAGKLEGEAQITKDDAELTKGTFTPSFTIGLQGGMGVQGAAALYADGSATASLTCDMLNKHQVAKLSGKADLVLEVFIWSKALPVAEAEAVLYDSYYSDGTVFGGDQDIYAMLEAEPFHLVTREEMNGESADGGTSGGATKVQLLHVGSDLYKFFLEDRGGDQSNRFMLSYSKLVDGSWTDAVPVADDGTLDTYFDVATDGTNIYVVWSNSTKLFDDNTVSIDEMFGCQEICYTTISADGTIAAPVQVTDNSAMDVLPVATTIGGNTYLAWYYTENGLETNTDVGDYYLKYTCVQAGTPGEISSVSFGKSAISSITASSASGLPLATVVSNASTVDAFTDDVTTVIDMSNGEMNDLDTANKTIGKSISGTIDGDEKVFWMENGNVAYADAITSENPTYIFTEDTIPGTISSDNYTVITVSGSTYLIWTENGAEKNDPAIAMTTVYTNGVWSAVHKLTDLSTGNICELDGYLNSDGKLVLVYMAKTISTDANGTITQQTISLEKTVEPEKTVSIDRVDFAVTDAIPGEALPITLTVTNTGNTTIESLDLQIDSQAGENYTTTLTGLSIAPGTDTEVEITDFVLSSQLTTKNNNEDPYVYTVTAKASDSEITARETFEIGHSRVALYKEDVYYMNNREHVVLALENQSGFPVENVQVQILEGSTEGVMVYHNTFESLTANEHYAITLDVEDITSSSLFAFISTGCDAGEEPECVELILSDSSTMAKLTVESLGCGTTTPAGNTMYTFGESVEIQANPQEGYLFDGWYSNRELTYLAGNEDTANALIVMPAGDTTVTAKFVSETPYNFTLNADSADVFAGDSFQLEAIFPSPEQTGKVIWSSSDENVATVSGRGVVDCLSAGTAEITAACGEYIHTCQITVSYVDVTEILVVYPTLNLAMGESALAEVLTEPENGTASLQWTSSDETVATVDRKGNVTAVGYGTAVITATSILNEAITAECTVNVVRPVEAILLDKQELNLTLVDNKADLSVSFEPEDANYGKNITWSVEDSGILELTASGEFNENLSVTAINQGITTITATTEDGHSASCAVTVRDIVNVTDLQELQSSHPYESNLDRTWIYTDETKDFLILSFSQESEVDYSDALEILDAEGATVYNSVEDGSYFNGMKILVPGNTAQIRLTSGRNDEEYYGFRVEEISDTILEDDIDIEYYDLEYTGKTQTPMFGVTFGRHYLNPGAEYTLQFSNNKNVGTATVKFIGRGYFEGITKTEAFRIVPATTRLNASMSSKGITLSWAASKGAGGYLLYRNVDGNYTEEGEYWTLLTKLSSSKKSYTDTKTDSEHAYEYRLVPYKDITKNKKTTRYEGYSAEYGPITRIGPVKNLTYEWDPASATVTLKWDELPGADGYYFYHKEGANGFERFATEETYGVVELYDTGKHEFKVVPYKYINGYQQCGVETKPVALYDLAAPDLMASNSDKGVQLEYEYSYAEGMTGMKIERSTNGGKTWKAYKTIKAAGNYYPNEYFHGTLTDTSSKTSGARYQYRARTYVTVGKKTYYSPWSESNTVMYLSKPTISTVKTAADGGLAVSWKKVTGAQRYRIERWYYDGQNDSVDESFTYVIENSAEKTHTFLDTSATGAGFYEYSIQAVASEPGDSEQGEYGATYSSAWSAAKRGHVLHKTALTWLDNAQKGIRLIWNNSAELWMLSNFADGFEIWRSTNYNAETETGTWSKIKTVKLVNSVNDTSATSNTKVYSYKIRAYTKENGITYYGEFSDVMSLCKMTPPKLKSASALTGGGFQLKFGYVKDATRYEILRYDNSDSEPVQIAQIIPTSTKTTTYTVTDASATDINNAYTYEIRAIREKAGVNSHASCYVYAYNYGAPEVTVENTEKGTMIYAFCPDQYTVDYGYASYYTIYRSVNGGAYKTLKTVKADFNGKLSYNDTTAKSGNTYSYQVVASGKNAMNVFTAVKSAGTEPIICRPGPKLVSLENSLNGITVKWKTQKNMPAADGYAIYRSQDNLNYTLVDTVAADVFTFTDTTADYNDYYYVDDNVYYYKVAVIVDDQPVAYTKAQKYLYMFAPYRVEAWNQSNTTAIVNWWCDEGYWEGIEVRYKTGNTTKIVRNKNVLTGLKSNTYYEISVRCYIRLEGKTYYSAWSEPTILNR